MLTTIFFLSRFFFFDIESDKDVFDDESDNDGSGYGFTRESGLSGLCPFLKFPLVVFVDCQGMESQNLVVVSVEYFQSEYFPAQKLF